MKSLLRYVTRAVRKRTRGCKHSNCIIFALSLWWARWLRGSDNNSIKARRSHVKWGILHMLHKRVGRDSGNTLLVSYKPNTAKKRDIEIVFEGHVEWGDKIVV